MGAPSQQSAMYLLPYPDRAELQLGIRTNVPPLVNPWLYFKDRRTVAGIVARRDMFGAIAKGDVALGERLEKRIWRKQRKDGSWGGSIWKTAVALDGLVDLRVDAEGCRVRNAVDWMLSQQDLARLFADHLFTFPPIDDGLPEKELRLPGGLRVRNRKCIVRIAALTLLRVCLRLGFEKLERVQHHLLLATRILSSPDHDDCADCRETVLLALSHHPVISRSGPVMVTLNWLGTLQRSSGEWRGCDLYHTLYTIAHFPDPSARLQFQAALPALAERQNRDGSWGRGTYQETRTLAVTFAMHAFGLIQPDQPT